MSIPNDDNIVASDTPVYAISIAAQLCGLHPQTLRQYDRVGLVAAHRVAGRNRLYSARDVQRLRYVSQLSAEGLSIEGIKRVIELRNKSSPFVNNSASSTVNAHHALWWCGDRNTGIGDSNGHCIHN